MFGEFDSWKLLAGLGIFLFGIFLMEESIKKLSGRAFKRLIQKYTNGRLRSIFSGFVSTAVLQSSSAVALMTLAFVGSGIVTMANAIGIVLGSNIGTTLTSWIIATIGFKVNIESLALPFLGLGGLGIIFLGSSPKYSNISKLLVGFGFLFLGLDYMKASVEALATQLDLQALHNYGWGIYLLVGFALTAIMQSSSATMALILTSLHSNIITFDEAAMMVIGGNMGTTITILIGSIGGVPIKKRVALSHVIFNVTTAGFALLLFPVLTFAVHHLPGFKHDAMSGLALFHTLFNLLGVLLFFPFIALLAKGLTRLFPDKKILLTHHITKTVTTVPEAAIPAIKNELLHLIHEVVHYVYSLLELSAVNKNPDQIKLFVNPSKQSLQDQYEGLKMLQAEIFTFAAGIQKNELLPEESKELSRYLHASRLAVYAAKSMKDVRHNFDDLKNAENDFVQQEYLRLITELINFFSVVISLLQDSSNKEKIKTLLRLFKKLEEGEELFINNALKAVQKHSLDQGEVATLLGVNRAYEQASYQLLSAVREVVLSEKELQHVEELQEILQTND